LALQPPHVLHGIKPWWTCTLGRTEKGMKAVSAVQSFTLGLQRKEIGDLFILIESLIDHATGVLVDLNLLK